MARATRGRFREEFKRIRIEAGYVNDFNVIFDGEIKEVQHERQDQLGVETTIKAADAELSWTKAKVNRTLGTAVAPLQVVRALASELRPFGVSVGRIYGLEGEPAFRRPYVMNGMVRDRLDELARSYNARWSIQNGVFEWIPNNQSGTAVRVVTLSSSTGMIGIPTPTEKGVKVKSLLRPDLKPNDTVEIVSDFLDGTRVVRTDADGSATRSAKSSTQLGGGLFRINSVLFTGSSHNDDFYSEIDCQRMAGGVVELEPSTEQAVRARAGGI